MEKYLNRKRREKVESEGWFNKQCNRLTGKRYLSVEKSICSFWRAVQVLLRAFYTSMRLKLLVKKEEKKSDLSHQKLYYRKDNFFFACYKHTTLIPHFSSNRTGLKKKKGYCNSWQLQVSSDHTVITCIPSILNYKLIPWGLKFPLL